MNAPAAGARRQLGLGTAAALVVASMIGTGVFTTSGFLLADLHSPWLVLAAWAAGGVQAALGALCYGALARRLPESGGEYLFLSRTLHPAAGYVAGWLSLLVGFSAPLAGAAFAFGEYTKTWLPDGPPKLAGTLLIVLFSAVHAWHVQRGAWLQNAAVVLKVALMAGFAALAWPRLPALPAADPAPASVGAFAVSLVWISFSYAGWNAAVYIGGEVRDAERNLPRALLLGTGVVTALYLALNYVFVFAAPVRELAGRLEIGRLAAGALGGRVWAEALTALVAICLVSSVSSLVMAGPRVYAQMATDGCVPRIFAAPAGPPRTSIVLQAGVALVLLWSATFDALLTYIGFTLSLSTAATVAGLMVLRRREGPRLPVPGWPWVPALFMASVLGMAGFSVARRPVESLLGLATMAVGWVVWAFTRSGAGEEKAGANPV
jgi:APA family basic amino acid/polyamine antiporter